MKKVTTFGTAMAFIGAMIGAGFASGQEILQFFGGFGINGVWGIVVAAVTYAACGALIMLVAIQMGTTNYNYLIVPGKNKVLLAIVDVFMAFLLFGMFSVMVVGASSLLQQQFGFPLLVGGILMVLLAILTVYWGSDSLMASFNIVVPLMIICAIVISVLAIVQAPEIAFHDTTNTVRPNSMVGNWFLSALLFVFYSVLGAVGTLPDLALKLKERKGAIVSSLLGATVLGAIALIVYVAVMSNIAQAANYPMPMLTLANQISPICGIIYIFVLFAAIYTTAVGALFGIKSRVDNMQKLSPAKKNLIIVAVAVVALFATKVGFVNLVSFLYPLYGYMGILVFVGMTTNFIRTRRRAKVSR